MNGTTCQWLELWIKLQTCETSCEPNLLHSRVTTVFSQWHSSSISVCVQFLQNRILQFYATDLNHIIKTLSQLCSITVSSTFEVVTFMEYQTASASKFIDDVYNASVLKWRPSVNFMPNAQAFFLSEWSIKLDHVYTTNVESILLVI